MIGKALFRGAVDPNALPPAPGKVVGLKCAEPGCDALLVLRWSRSFDMWFYGCTRYPDCNGVLPANKKDGSPRGRPRTRELQSWRNKAHKAFDPLWQGGLVRRQVAYAWLRAASGWSHKEAHMMQLDAEGCQRVIELVETKGPGTEFWVQWYRPRGA